jgi:hypothetical protein
MLESAEQNLERIQSGVTNEADMAMMIDVDLIVRCAALGVSRDVVGCSILSLLTKSMVTDTRMVRENYIMGYQRLDYYPTEWGQDRTSISLYRWIRPPSSA